MKTVTRRKVFQYHISLTHSQLPNVGPNPSFPIPCFFPRLRDPSLSQYLIARLRRCASIKSPPRENWISSRGKLENDVIIVLAKRERHARVGAPSSPHPSSELDDFKGASSPAELLCFSCTQG